MSIDYGTPESREGTFRRNKTFDEGIKTLHTTDCQLITDWGRKTVLGALSAVMRNMFSVDGNFDDKGFLALGFAGHQPDLASVSQSFRKAIFPGSQCQRLECSHTIDYGTPESREGTFLNKINEWYLSDGWYSDGAEFSLDYYNSFVIHPMYVRKAIFPGSQCQRLECSHTIDYGTPESREGTFRRNKTFDEGIRIWPTIILIMVAYI